MSGHIEHKFEEWFDNTTGFTQEDKVLCFEAYKDAYDQGRRDLIKSMGDPVAWVSVHKNFTGCTTNKHNSEEWKRDKTGKVYAAYKLPEDAPDHPVDPSDTEMLDYLLSQVGANRDDLKTVIKEDKENFNGKY